MHVQTEARAAELYSLCESKGWKVIIGIKPEQEENIDDIVNLQRGIKLPFLFNLFHPEMLHAPVEVANNINGVAANKGDWEMKVGEVSSTIFWRKHQETKILKHPNSLR